MRNEALVDLLLKQNVLKFGEFTLKSGRIAPYFLNFGDIKTGGSIYALSEFYADILKNEIDLENRILFGPAYKGIPLAVATACKMKEKYDIDIPFLFNRKEAKDHGEGGNLVGMKPTAGTKITIIEDVITAGTAIRESLNMFDNSIVVDSVIIAVDRMEKGMGEKSTTLELEEEYGVKVYSIANIKEIVEYLYNREIDGKVYIDNEIRASIESYFNKYTK